MSTGKKVFPDFSITLKMSSSRRGQKQGEIIFCCTEGGAVSAGRRVRWDPVLSGPGVVASPPPARVWRAAEWKARRPGRHDKGVAYVDEQERRGCLSFYPPPPPPRPPAPRGAGGGPPREANAAEVVFATGEVGSEGPSGSEGGTVCVWGGGAV